MKMLLSISLLFISTYADATTVVGTTTKDLPGGGTQVTTMFLDGTTQVYYLNKQFHTTGGINRAKTPFVYEPVGSDSTNGVIAFPISQQCAETQLPRGQKYEFKSWDGGYTSCRVDGGSCSNDFKTCAQTVTASSAAQSMSGDDQVPGTAVVRPGTSSPSSGSSAGSATTPR